MPEPTVTTPPLSYRQAQALRALGIEWLSRGKRPASARSVALRMPSKDGGHAPFNTARIALKDLHEMGLIEQAPGLSKDGGILWLPTERGERRLIACVAPRLAAEAPLRSRGRAPEVTA